MGGAKPTSVSLNIKYSKHSRKLVSPRVPRKTPGGMKLRWLP